MSTETVEYQEHINLKGVHPSYDKYSSWINEFFDWLKERNVHTFEFGFAWESDESHLRHLSAYLNPLPEGWFEEDAFPEFSEDQPPNDHPIHFANQYPMDLRPRITQGCGCVGSDEVFGAPPDIRIGNHYQNITHWDPWLHECFRDVAGDIDSVWAINVQKRTVSNNGHMYITEPTLGNAGGFDLEWNQHQR
jgi:hypothetical protein